MKSSSVTYPMNGPRLGRSRRRNQRGPFHSHQALALRASSPTPSSCRTSGIQAVPSQKERSCCMFLAEVEPSADFSLSDLQSHPRGVLVVAADHRQREDVRLFAHFIVRVIVLTYLHPRPYLFVDPGNGFAHDAA